MYILFVEKINSKLRSINESYSFPQNNSSTCRFAYLPRRYWFYLFIEFCSVTLMTSSLEKSIAISSCVYLRHLKWYFFVRWSIYFYYHCLISLENMHSKKSRFLCQTSKLWFYYKSTDLQGRFVLLNSVCFEHSDR